MGAQTDIQCHVAGLRKLSGGSAWVILSEKSRLVKTECRMSILGQGDRLSKAQKHQIARCIPEPQAHHWSPGLLPMSLPRIKGHFHFKTSKHQNMYPSLKFRMVSVQLNCNQYHSHGSFPKGRGEWNDVLLGWGFTTQALLTFETGEFFAVGPVLCTIGCLVANQASTF